MQTTLILLITAMPLIQAAEAREAETPGGLAIGVITSAEYFTGIPKYMAVTMRNSGEDQVQVSSWKISEAYYPMTLVLTSGVKYRTKERDLYRGLIRGEYEVDDGRSRPIWRPRWTIPPGGTRRELVNAGVPLESLALPEGKYDMDVQLWENLHRPLAMVKAMKLNVSKACEGEPFGILGVTSRGVDDSAAIIGADRLMSVTNEGVRAEIALALVVRKCITTGRIEDIDIDAFIPFIAPHFKPDVELYRLEVLLAQDKQADAAKLKEWIIKNCPDLEIQVAEAENGDGQLKRLRGGRK